MQSAQDGLRATTEGALREGGEKDEAEAAARER
jgi:hypothetical protein